jgi:pyridoxine 5-phosphate synthase
MVRLSVNVNKVATLRNARGGERPSVVEAARVAIAAGAHGITVHPRPDGRHIRRNDVLELARLTAELGVELNVEGYPSPELLALVEEVQAAQCTLVPDPPEVLTSNAGWKLAGAGWLREVLERLRHSGIRSSLFVDTDIDEAARARDLGADRVELYTEAYASAFHGGEREPVLARYVRMAQVAAAAGLGVNAGHDLDLQNVGLFTARVPGLLELSIGHALVSDALLMGLAPAVRAYLEAMQAGE